MCVINGIYPIRSLQSNDWPNYIPSVHQYSTRGLVKFPADPTRCGLLSSGLTRGQIAFQTCLNAVTSINNAPAADIAAQIIVDSCLGWYKQNPCNNDVLSTLMLVWNNRSVCDTILHIQCIPITIYIIGLLENNVWLCFNSDQVLSMLCILY